MCIRLIVRYAQFFERLSTAISTRTGVQENYVTRTQNKRLTFFLTLVVRSEVDDAWPWGSWSSLMERKGLLLPEWIPKYPELQNLRFRFTKLIECIYVSCSM